MITLPNGDKWILDDKEWESLNIPYEDVIACKIPEMSYETFIDRLTQSVLDKDSEDLNIIPRKHSIFLGGGFWDANFDAFEEVFPAIAVRKRSYPWCSVYAMPWGKTYVVYTQMDKESGEAITAVTVYANLDDYRVLVSNM